jgi:heptosyltransferase-2
MTAAALSTANARRIIVRGVNWLGDAVMTTPALLRLREAFPSARISILTAEKLADLWQDHPAVDRVLAVRRDEGLWSVAARLHSERFDLGLALPNSLRSAAELWFGGVRHRVGYAANGRGFLLSQAIGRPPGFAPMCKRSVAEVQRLVTGKAKPSAAPQISTAPVHHLHHYLHLAAVTGASAAPCAPLLKVSAEAVAAIRSQFGLGRDVTWLGLNPGAEYGPAKRWPVSRFAAMAREAAAWPGWGVVLFGGKADEATARTIESEVRSASAGWPSTPRLANLAGRTSLRELCASLRVCRVVVTNDTGPMHVAAALGVPVVAVFGSTSPELTGPGLPGDCRHEIVRAATPCAPCFLRDCPIDLRCLNAIGPATVLAAVNRVISRTGLETEPC